jgi:hypothetical protein
MNFDALESKKFFGIQLACFEIIWPLFPWIKAIHLASSPEMFFVHVQIMHSPSSKHQNDCSRLLGEIFDVISEGTAARMEVKYSECLPLGSTYRKVIS